MTLRAQPLPVPNDWDRRGLPAWAYHSPALFDLEAEEIFLTHWQVVGHLSDIPAKGDWLSFDMLGERALIMRGRDGVVRAFHNQCRHRGARLTDGGQGHCRGALVCPFHGWVYNTDGSLRGPARPDTFGEMDTSKFGLIPIELEVWQGFLFIRFHPGPQPAPAQMMATFEPDFADYRATGLLPAGAAPWQTELEVNWKSVRDVDNEGYHVAMAHPALQDLYGPNYRDEVFARGLSHSIGTFGDRPGRRWSVRNYVKLAPEQAWLPPHLRKSWTYYGFFPNAVFAFTPESAQYYQDIPVSTGLTSQRGRLYRRPDEDRPTRIARYLAQRIDQQTSVEDRQLSIWSNESMQSRAFAGFHLSDLEYGVRRLHDELRLRLPILNCADRPEEARMRKLNEIMTLEITQDQED
jgi:phenylpropionate dioxygenase-like ring-hydroxylating dioxygenase large terminal subunit